MKKPNKPTNGTKPASGRPVVGAIRWTIENASVEFGMDRHVLKKELVRQSIEPDEDGRYSTGKITAVVFGDMAAEKLRKAKADATSAEIAVAAAMETLLPAAQIEAQWADALVRYRLVIQRAKYMDGEQKEKLLTDLIGVKVDDEG